MTKILGGRYRNIRVINGKTCIKVQRPEESREGMRAEPLEHDF